MNDKTPQRGAVMSVKQMMSVAALAAVCGLAGSSASASVTVFGGPAWENATGTGYLGTTLPVAPGASAGNGAAIGSAMKRSSGVSLGSRALRWDASGSAAIELGNLGTDVNGLATNTAYAINSGGAVVGSAGKYSGGTLLGERAVRWDASGVAATELDNLGTDSGGFTRSVATAINTTGTVVGYARKHSGGVNLGDRAVRWDSSGTAATELGNLGTGSDGGTFNYAYAVNALGTAVGTGDKWSGGTWRGSRAVRWGASGTATTELGNLGVASDGVTYSAAFTINAGGTAVGFARKYSGSTWLGTRAVRWDASGTAATELGTISTTPGGYTESTAYAVNGAGTSVGYARRYSGTTSLGDRAVRWDASGTVATELGNLGVSSSGAAMSIAYAINAAGLAVGYSEVFAGGTSLGNRAVYWGLDGVVVDLNTLLSPTDTTLWTLTEARGISDTNWVTGTGTFDPDGAGGLAPYGRAFLIQIPAPGAAVVLAMGGVVSLRRRRVV